MCQPTPYAPGKVAPKTAGILLADAVIRILEERVT